MKWPSVNLSSSQSFKQSINPSIKGYFYSPLNGCRSIGWTFRRFNFPVQNKSLQNSCISWAGMRYITAHAKRGKRKERTLILFSLRFAIRNRGHRNACVSFSSFEREEKYKLVIYRLRVGPYSEKLWPRIENAALGLGQHFLDLCHSFSLHGPPSREITNIFLLRKLTL